MPAKTSSLLKTENTFTDSVMELESYRETAEHNPKLKRKAQRRLQEKQQAVAINKLTEEVVSVKTEVETLTNTVDQMNQPLGAIKAGIEHLQKLADKVEEVASPTYALLKRMEIMVGEVRQELRTMNSEPPVWAQNLFLEMKSKVDETKEEVESMKAVVLEQQKLLDDLLSQRTTTDVPSTTHTLGPAATSQEASLNDLRKQVGEMFIDWESQIGSQSSNTVNRETIENLVDIARKDFAEFGIYPVIPRRGESYDSSKHKPSPSTTPYSGALIETVDSIGFELKNREGKVSFFKKPVVKCVKSRSSTSATGDTTVVPTTCVEDEQSETP